MRIDIVCVCVCGVLLQFKSQNKVDEIQLIGRRPYSHIKWFSQHASLGIWNCQFIFL